MKFKINKLWIMITKILLVALPGCLLLSACGPGQFLGATLTPVPTGTYTPTPTYTPSVTPSPIPSSTPTSTPSPAYLDIIPALAAIVSGTGVPGAAVYDPDLPGPHPVVILTTSGTAYTAELMTDRGMVSVDWNDTLPSGWSPVSLSETELVVLISPERKIDEGAIQYNIGPAVTSYRYESDLEIREARTGRTLSIYTYKGNRPMAPEVASYNLTEVNGSRITYAYLEYLICPVIIHQGCWGVEKILPHYTYWVYSLAFSPDGLSLASGSNDAVIWDVASGEELQTFSNSSSGMESVAFSPDGRSIATSGFNLHEIFLWDTASGELKQTLTGHTEPVNSLAWSPDGSSIASGSNDDTVILWNTVRGERLQTLVGHNNDVSSVAFSPDGSSLASGGMDSAVILWDAASGDKTQTLFGPISIVEEIAFSPDGRTLASNMYGGFLLWDVDSGTQLQPLAASGGYGLAFSPDGRILATGIYDGAIILWDIASRTRIQTLPASEFSDYPTEVHVQSLSFSPDGLQLASGSSDGRILIWSLTIPKP